MTTTSRRSFLKTAGIITAAAAVLNPAQIFALNSRDRKVQGSKKMELSFVPYDAQMKVSACFKRIFFHTI